MTAEGSSIDQFLRDFRETVVSATGRLRQISPEQSSRPPGPEKWSVKEILGHLIDSAANNHQRFVRAQFTNDLVFPGYQQERWVSAQKYIDEPWPDLIQLWSSYNMHLAHVISAIPEESMMRARIHHNLDQLAMRPVDKNDATTLDYFVRDYLAHMKHHLEQIFSIEIQ